MSRRLIIGILVILIIGVIGGTVALVVSRLRSDSTAPSTTTTGGDGSLQEAPTGGQTVVDPTGDDDGDGLPNSDEALWGTDINNLDTDGDGFLDGEEVAANHNPTIAGPDDQLPTNFEPGRDLAPLEAAPTESVAVDQYFARDLELNLAPGRNLTQEYESQFSEEEQNAENLRGFVLEQNIVTQLPTPSDQALNVGTNDGAVAIAEYLETAGATTPFSDPYALAYALEDLNIRGDNSGILSIAHILDIHQRSLIELQVPPSAVNYHRLLLGYSELLKSTFEQMAGWDTDRVKATLAARQLDAVDQIYYPLIQQERVRLQRIANIR